MERIYFLPQWYLERKMNKNRRIMKFCIVAIIIIDLIFLDVLISRLSKVKLLDNSIKQKIILQKDEYLKKNKEKNENNKTLDTFYIFKRNIPLNVKYENVYIENKAVSIEINPESFDYITFINELEAKNEFILKNLVLPNAQENKNLKVNLELK